MKINYCKKNICHNSAPCISGLDDFKCLCPQGYTGKYCSTNIDDCSPSPCNINGTDNCTDGVSSFKCICKDGYSGVLCNQSKQIKLLLILLLDSYHEVLKHETWFIMQTLISYLV